MQWKVQAVIVIGAVMTGGTAVWTSLRLDVIHVYVSFIQYYGGGFFYCVDIDCRMN